MKIVAQQSEEELARQRAAERIIWPLREMVANCMRVARGAGSPAEIGRQAVAVIDAFQAHWDALRVWPSSYDIAQALDLTARKHDGSELPYDELRDAFDQMTSGSLQIAASRLVGQGTQEAAGRAELVRGLQQAEARRARNRAETLARPPARKQVADATAQAKVELRLKKFVAGSLAPAKSRKPRRGD